MNKYKQLTLEGRYVIYALIQEGFSRQHVSAKIGVHPSTIGRELHRNSHDNNYSPHVAHTLAVRRRHMSRKPAIVTDEVCGILRQCLRKDWSPEQVSGRLKSEGKLSISHETIYQFVYRDKASGGRLYRHLRCQKVRRRKYGSGKRVIIPNRTSIDERPCIVDSRNRIGDWEVDTIISSNKKEAILTLAERHSRFTLMAKLDSRESYHTGQKMIDLLRSYSKHVLTITADNGLEFSSHQLVSTALKADFYFAHPYKSWERGLNENTNGLIRQYFPKKSNFQHLTKWDLQRTTRKLNSRPRKCLGYRTPKEVFYNGGIALQT